MLSYAIVPNNRTYHKDQVQQQAVPACGRAPALIQVFILVPAAEVEYLIVGDNDGNKIYTPEGYRINRISAGLARTTTQKYLRKYLRTFAHARFGIEHTCLHTSEKSTECGSVTMGVQS